MKNKNPFKANFIKIYDETQDRYFYAVVVMCSKCGMQARIVPDPEVTPEKYKQRQFVCDDCKKKLQ